MSLESVQLIKCQVRNGDGQISYRLIERDNYELWQYLVTKKHNITILESSVCLWVNNQEFANKQEIYQRAGQSEVANKIVLMIYDDHGSYNNTCRYVLDADTEVVEKILARHIPETQRKLQQYSLEIESGHIIITGPLNKLQLCGAVEAA